MGFFPAAFHMTANDPTNRQYLSKAKFPGGLARVNQMPGKNGFSRFWDAEGQAPYLFNPVTKLRISYEDIELVKAKAMYVMKHNLAGIMYWDYFSDPKHKLLNTIDNVFKNQY